MTPSDEPSPSRPLPDLVGGRYRIVSRLGVGGMGVVYKATDLQLHRAVAVKALEERRLNMPGAAGRLKTEALAAASLDHPYICKVYELVETATDTFIIMEFVEGETLASMLKRGPLPILQTLQLGREIAEGLANAHANGLVHRDVKPSNVMVTTHGHVKLLDFGVAGADVESTPGDATRTLSPQLTVHAGTPQYMAPEQAAGQPITTRADLFSLGVVLYECLTAQLPFSGTTTFDYVRHVLQSAPRRLDRVAPETPADLVELIDRLLEKQPADRPASAEVVVNKLRELEDALTVPSGGIRTARQARAGRRWKTVALAAIAVAAIGSTWRYVWQNSSGIDTPRQLRPFVTTSALETTSRISPDGEWVSFIASAGGSSRILVQRIDGGEARPLTLGPGEPASQIWSPDGSQIAAVMKLDGRDVLQIYPAFFGGEPVQTVALGDIQSAGILRWIGRDLYFRVSVQGISIRRLSLDSPAGLEDISGRWTLGGSLRNADVRPDGAAVVIAISAGGHEDLWTANLDGSNLKQLTADAFFDKDPKWIGRGDAIVFQSNRGGQVDLWMMDIRTKALTALTSGEAAETAESSSADGSIISFTQQTRSANLWAFAGSTPTQLTQDSLSDYSPAVSGDGQMVAFQRSQANPARGYTILDSKVFVSSFDGRSAIDARPVADGFAADFTRDGRWLSYLQVSDQPARMALSIRDLRGGTTTKVSSTTALPSLAMTPVEWSARVTAWTADGASLFFVDQPDRYMIRRYDTATSKTSAPLATAPEKAYYRDLYVEPDSGRLAFLQAEPGRATAFELDPTTGNVREIASFQREQRAAGIIGRGWFDKQFLIVRSIKIREDLSADVEIVLVKPGSPPRVAGHISGAYAQTVRLHPAKRALYMTRTEKGTDNIYTFSLDAGVLAQVTQNALPGVTFSGFQPIGAGGVLGSREDRREDIWLIQKTATPRPGNPAGR